MFLLGKSKIHDVLSYVFTYINGNIPNRVKNIIYHNQHICNSYKIPFKIFFFELQQGECAAGKSDWLRLERACRDSRIMYVDWDCLIKKFPKFDPKIPMMGPGFWNNEKQIDLWSFYNGDKLDLFNLILKASIPKKGQYASYADFLTCSGIKKEFKTFTSSELKHLNLAQGRIVKIL